MTGRNHFTYTAYCASVFLWIRKGRHLIVAVVNQKGGCGKTTIALGLAGVWTAEGAKVLLIDADPQGTASDWAAVAAGAGVPPPFGVVKLTRPTLHKEVADLAAAHDHVVIDGAPRNYELARSAIAAADMVAIPVQPSGADFWASRETVELVKASRAFKETQKAVFVISRRIGRTVLGRGIADALAEFGLPILAAGTTQRVAYAEAMTAGKLVSGAAAAEMRTILEELRGLVA